MKLSLKLIFVILLIIGLSACLKKENVYQGIYDVSNQFQKSNPDGTNNLGVVTSPDKEPPSYQQYKKEREVILEDQKLPPSQPGNK
jgi:hypothetical protein